MKFLSSYTQKAYLKWIRPDQIKIIVEAGSRDGIDAFALHERYPKAHIYSFECNPECIEMCENNLKSLKYSTFIPLGHNDRDWETIILI